MMLMTDLKKILTFPYTPNEAVERRFVCVCVLSSLFATAKMKI